MTFYATTTLLPVQDMNHSAIHHVQTTYVAHLLLLIYKLSFFIFNACSLGLA